MEDLLRAALTNALGAAVLGAMVAGLALILVRRPAVVHCLWVVVLLKLVTPPLFEVSVGEFEDETVATLAAPLVVEEPISITLTPAELAALEESSAIFEAEAVESPAVLAFDAAPDRSWSSLAWQGLMAAWLAGSAATAVLATVRVVRFQSRLRDASPAGEWVEREVAELSAAMGLRRPPRVEFIDARTTPMIWSLGLCPRLILPQMLWKRLDGRCRTLLLTHELAHLKRGDHLLRFFELGVTVLYWWLPVVWWVRRALRDVEEQCCDAWVVWMFPEHARAYAETLLDTVDFLNPSADPEPLLASGFGKVQHLRRRLTMVMTGTTSRSLGWQGSLGALALAGVLLPMSPTWADKPDEPAVQFEAVQPADVVVFGEAIDGRGESLSFRAVGDGDALKTIDFVGPVTLAAVADDDENDEAKDKGGDKKDDGKDKGRDGDKKDRAEVRKEIRLQVRGEGKEAGEAIKKAAEGLKAQLKELEAGKPEGEDREAQIKGLKAALEQLGKLARRPDAVELRGMPFDGPGQTFTFQPEKLTVEPFGEGQKNRFKLGRLVDRRFNADDPKAAEALKRVDELSKVVAEKQRELSEAAGKLAEAHKKLAEMQGEVVIERVMPDVAERIKQARVREVQARDHREAEVRDRRPDAGDQSRIDSLEQKLNKVLEELESLKKPRAESADEK
ncbi:M56 family metallopeptidase [Planctomyces sp. SH-PL62]|uniref:M56 family metallopeptidase n=1 Tax=Planctomyces sp. SH-PL62 TaxID=1636152 RepID=UPI00078DE44E|nr:M56 family metallopeptidase [Planctomyces sp. SH-PL62]AMV37990.1 Regulatory protein BlaR1 [Planctomyces sp. SH-PL62]